uniref:Uncharacterized protein TCIL3000_4_3840 n=1 Tax=Trypanosoma congolense (strain IL3000) TaxID=1068625 RepID=G0ULM5_TRYCI|nr:unnamed protein product [Trypanosoma congolense IL3000]
MIEETNNTVIHRDVVERLSFSEVPKVNSATCGVSGEVNGGSSGSSLRPIRAVVGRAFPKIDTSRFYGNNINAKGKPNRTHRAGVDTDAAAKVADSPGGFTAHVQPGLGSDVGCPPFGTYDGVSGIASRAQQHQWGPKEFDALERGYYTVAPRAYSAAHAGAEGNRADVPSGEAYMELLQQFFRSAVRKHREYATAALRTRLLIDKPLKERCTTGPNCAQIFHFVIGELSAAGHSTLCRSAAECLVLLLFDPAAEVTEAVGEIGTPVTDVAERVEDDRGDVSFAELSEWMRGGEDRSRALEKLGLTNAVIDALGLLPPALAARLLLGSGVLLLPHVGVRVAADPRFVRFLKGRLCDVVLGTVALGDVAVELLLLRHVLHVREACCSIISLLHETLVLFIKFVCSVSVGQLQTSEDAVACLGTFLVLRAAVRHGFLGLFTDTADALLSATAVGAEIAAEMWLLGTAAGAADGKPGASPAIEALGMELARAALRTVQSHLPTAESDVVEGSEVTRLGSLIGTLSSMHYLATYVTLNGDPIEMSVLFGTGDGDPQSRIKEFMAATVLTSRGLQQAFLRLTSGWREGSSSALEASDAFAGGGGEKVGLSKLNPSVLIESCLASLTHARVRLAVAISGFMDSIDCEVTAQYATALAASFQEKCFGLNDVMGRLMPDELGTMVEVVHLMRGSTCVTSSSVDTDVPGSAVQQQPNSCASRNSSRRSCSREAYIATIFVFHSVALTKHGQDAAAGLILALLGLPDTTAMHAPSAERAAPSEPLVELAKSLHRAVVQTKWPWFLFPLYDEELTEKRTWCAWMHRALGAHQRMKDVLQWDLVLCHVLRWALSLRNSSEEWDDGCVCVDVEVLRLLDGLCIGVLPRVGRPVCSAASDVLKAFAATVPLYEEGTMEWGLFGSLALTCTACEPTAAVAIVQLLSQTILEDVSGSDGVSLRPLTRAKIDQTLHIEEVPADVEDDFIFPSSTEELLRRWAASGELISNAPQGGRTPWDVKNFVDVLHAANSNSYRGFASECVVAEPQAVGVSGSRAVRELVEGITRVYLRQGPLSAFEQQALRHALQQLQWCPACLREELSEIDEGRCSH